jgi:hypothetical protein
MAHTVRHDSGTEDARAFATDAVARAVADRALARGCGGLFVPSGLACCMARLFVGFFSQRDFQPTGFSANGISSQRDFQHFRLIGSASS